MFGQSLQLAPGAGGGAGTGTPPLVQFPEMTFSIKLLEKRLHLGPSKCVHAVHPSVDEHLAQHSAGVDVSNVGPRRPLGSFTQVKLVKFEALQEMASSQDGL